MFEGPKPYSADETAQIKKEMEEQADEKRKQMEANQPEEKPPERGEKLPEELELGQQEAIKEAKGEAPPEKPAEAPPAQPEAKPAEKPPEKPEEKAAPEGEKKPEEKVEKSKEQLLVEAREKFARIELKAESELKAAKKKGLEKPKEEIEGWKEARGEYLKALQGRRTELYEKALAIKERKDLPEDKLSEEFKKEMKNIVKATVVMEANNLYDMKNKVKLEAKGDASFAERAWKGAGRVVEKYRKMPLKYKLMISGGLLAGGMVAGAAGGATGAAIAGGVVAGRWLQRGFGGAATAVGLEGFIKRSQEKRAEKKTYKEFGDKLSDLIKNNDKSLDEKLVALEGSKTKEKRRRYLLAGAAGAVVASGLLGRAIRWGMGELQKPEGVGKGIKDWWTENMAGKSAYEVEMKLGSTGEPLEYPPETRFAYTGEPVEYPSEGRFIGITPEAPVSDIEIAGKGDSVWKMVSRQLEARYGGQFTGLDEARKTYIIDAFKDRVAENPGKFGLTDIENIKLGQKFDVFSLFEDRSGNAKIFEHAAGLKEGQMENILKNNRFIEEWFKTHPGQRPADGKIYEILYGKKPPISELPGYEVPIEEQRVHGFRAPSEELPGYEIKPEEQYTSPEELKGYEVEQEAAKGVRPEELPGYEAPPEEVTYQPEGSEYEHEPPRGLEQKLQEIMNNNEIANVKSIAFSEAEYRAIQQVKVEDLLKHIPSREAAWETWRGPDSIKLNDFPHDGVYGASEFKKHIKLAEFIRSFNPGEGMKELDIKQFLRTVGPYSEAQ